MLSKEDRQLGSIAFNSFGSQHPDGFELIEELAAKVREAEKKEGKPLNGFTLDLLLRDHYNDNYHSRAKGSAGKGDPFGLVEMLDTESYLDQSPLAAEIRMFIRGRYYEKTGLSLEKFLDLPVYIANEVKKVLGEEAAEIEQEKSKMAAEDRKQQQQQK